MPDLLARAQTLSKLHSDTEILALANVWDVVSAQVVAGTDGARALATASHSIAASFGYEDGENIPLDLHLDMVARIVEAVELPVSMDFEGGYGDAGETARRAIAAGVVGANLEDQMKPLDQAVSAVEDVLRAGRDAGIDFVLNARTDAFLKAPQGADRQATLKEATTRCQAFLEAGAPVVFVPGVVKPEEIAAATVFLASPRSASKWPAASPKPAPTPRSTHPAATTPSSPAKPTSSAPTSSSRSDPAINPAAAVPTSPPAASAPKPA